MRPVIVLIATTPRYEYLTSISIPSVVSQSQLPAAVIVVADRRALSLDEQQSLQLMLGNIPLITLQNRFLHGAAGSWNTGIDHISQHFNQSYIAILDDDDRWQPDHLSLCLANSQHGTADIVLSGINVIKDGSILVQNIPVNICAEDFLVGNPGWQGSNTFIAAEVAKAVGGFTNGLISSNDRDFAIRLLAEKRFSVSYTGKATVNWACGLSASALSAPGSVQKRRGCAQFLQLHGHRMSLQQRQQYFQRMEKLFHLTEHDILTELQRLS